MKLSRTLYILFLLWLILISGCGREEDPEIVPTPTPVVLAQWAAQAEASSAYGSPDWSPRRATGAPDVNVCDDHPLAWSSARGNGLEWLVLSYDASIHATDVHIYQTLGRGAIARVYLLDESETLHLIWEGTDTSDTCPGILSIPVAQTPYRVNGVRIELDESRTLFWNQIDAVQLVGIK